MQTDGRKLSLYIRNHKVSYKASGVLTLKIQRKTVCYDFEISLIEIRTISPWSITGTAFLFYSEKRREACFKIYSHYKILPLIYMIIILIGVQNVHSTKTIRSIVFL